MGQSKKKLFSVDEETFRFLSPQVITKEPEKVVTPVTEQPAAEPPVEQLPTDRPRAELPKATGPTEKERLKKLIPNSKERPETETDPTIAKLQNLKNPPKLASEVKYREPEIQKGPGQWAIFLSIDTKQQQTPHQLFLDSVFEAMRSRLQINVHEYSCDSCAVQLPLALEEYDRVLFFVDQHKETHLLKTLESIQAFSKKGVKAPLPFVSLGTLHSLPLFALILRQNSHEDQTFKKQLWLSLQQLAAG
jgi:hypothetical protein